jgi:hypothetical protein
VYTGPLCCLQSNMPGRRGSKRGAFRREYIFRRSSCKQIVVQPAGLRLCAPGPCATRPTCPSPLSHPVSAARAQTRAQWHGHRHGTGRCRAMTGMLDCNMQSNTNQSNMPLTAPLSCVGGTGTGTGTGALATSPTCPAVRHARSPTGGKCTDRPEPGGPRLACVHRAPVIASSPTSEKPDRWWEAYRRARGASLVSTA